MSARPLRLVLAMGVAATLLAAIAPPTATAQDIPGPDEEIPEGCIAHSVAIRTGDDLHEFAGMACSEWDVPEDCLEYYLTITTMEGVFVDYFNSCDPDAEDPLGEEIPGCLEYALEIRTPHHQVVAVPGECPASESSCVMYELHVVIGENSQSTWETDCQDPCADSGLVAEVGDDGAITLTWDGNPNGTYEMARVAISTGELAMLGPVNGTTYIDTDTVVGESYAYGVYDPETERVMCVVVTGVPFFGAPLLGLVAGAGGLGAYAWMRRRSG